MIFKVGDRVACYGFIQPEGHSVPQRPVDGRCTGTILYIDKKIGLNIKTDAFNLVNMWAHPKQCRKLVKKPRRRVFIAASHVEMLESGERLPVQAATSSSHWLLPKDSIEFIEVRKKNSK